MYWHTTYVFFGLAFAIQFTKKTAMNKLQILFMKHPTRRKYALMVADIIFVLIAIKMFINYNNIQLAIKDTRLQTIQKQQEREFTKNFLLPYEKSEEANLFLKHENNIFLPGEIIIKFQSQILTGNTGLGNFEKTFGQNIPNSGIGHSLNTPKESRQHFLQEKFE